MAVIELNDEDADWWSRGFGSLSINNTRFAVGEFFVQMDSDTAEEHLKFHTAKVCCGSRLK